MNKGYQYNPTLTEILWTIVKFKRDLLRCISPRLAEWFYSFCGKYLPKEETDQKSAPAELVKEEAKIITPPEEHGQTSLPSNEVKGLSTPPSSAPSSGIDLPTAKRQACSEQSERIETQPYIDRGPALPEHYGDDRIIALAKDPRCIFVYWDLKGFKSQEALKFHKGAKSWSLRVHHSGEDVYHDVPINVDTRNWYLWVADNKGYIIDLGFSTQDGEFLTLASSNPVQTPRAGTSQEYAEHWDFIFRVVKKGEKQVLGTCFSPEGVACVSPGERWYETWLESHVPGSPTLQTQKNG